MPFKAAGHQLACVAGCGIHIRSGATAIEEEEEANCASSTGAIADWRKDVPYPPGTVQRTDIG